MSLNNTAPKQDPGENWSSSTLNSVEIQKQVGLFIKEEREKQNLELDFIADKIKIRRFFLESIEEGSFEHLPGSIYTSGFVKTYVKFLGLNHEEILEILSRTQGFEKIDSNIKNIESEPPFISPSKVTLIISIFFISFLLGYFSYTSHSVQITPFKETKLKEDQPSFSLSSLDRNFHSTTTLIQPKGINLQVRRPTWIKIIKDDNTIVAARMLKPGEWIELNIYDHHYLFAGDGEAIEFYSETTRIPCVIQNPSNSSVPQILENFEINLQDLKSKIPNVQVEEQLSPQANSDNN